MYTMLVSLYFYSVGVYSELYETLVAHGYNDSWLNQSLGHEKFIKITIFQMTFVLWFEELLPQNSSQKFYIELLF